jgi:hypothetical protein
VTQFPFDIENDDDDFDRVPVSTLFRWYLYDMDVRDPNALGKAFDLLPVSDEGDQKEREDADSRLAAVDPLISFLNLYAHINSEYILETQKKVLLSMPGITPEVLAKEASSISMFYQNVTFAGLLTAFSAAIELGLIKVNGTFTGVQNE